MTHLLLIKIQMRFEASFHLVWNVEPFRKWILEKPLTKNQEVEDDVKDAPPIFGEGIQAIVDELKEINTDTTKDVLRIGLINSMFLKHYYDWSLKSSLVRA